MPITHIQSRGYLTYLNVLTHCLNLASQSFIHLLDMIYFIYYSLSLTHHNNSQYRNDWSKSVKNSVVQLYSILDCYP